MTKLITPRAALNKAYLKVKPTRKNIELFKSSIKNLLDRINDNESEEFQKNLISDFFKDVYYKNKHYINTKGRNDMVIHNGDTAKTPVGVIIEAKKESNRYEMVSRNNLNTKAIQELVLYFLRERIKEKNHNIKHLIITNVYEWYIFDVSVFERLVTRNKAIVKEFEKFEARKLTSTSTDFFYTEIAKPYIENIIQDIEVCYFDIRDYRKIIENTDSQDDNQLIVLFKIFSPEHLLKLPFSNDSNSLDKNFYAELLHIIGLSEAKTDGKRVIERNAEGKRNSGTLLEETIVQVDTLDKLNRVDKPGLYGNNTHERLFNIGLTLNITWINRILFLKLLEAQLITYHKGDKSYSFLTLQKIRNFDELNSLFFQVLARKYEDRDEDVKQLFSKIPYLNSSLFEPTELEHQTLFISNLKGNKKIPILSSTVLKDEQGKKRIGELACLEYLFDFLNAYDFSSEGSEDIQEENKTLINASVLGLIFEKINGYKDGSFYTPGVITMYMCREALRRAVLQKFREVKGWECQDLTELFNKISDKKEAADIINEIKICDPAVGSGHFLVSALNELIAIKWELGLILDKNGRSLRDYNVEVENDELIVTDEDGKLLDYKPNNKESQRVQETLFHEKETIIEKCLFGVDINPNSVKICRLRLWIELLKNAYYKNETELETLPNIDINIKNGNSLISRFSLDADLTPALRKSKWDINSYRLAVDTYMNAHTKQEKREMEQLIEAIKFDFKSEIDSPFKKKISSARAVVDKLATEINVQKQWGEKANKKLSKDFEKAVEKLKKIQEEKEHIETNKIYENAFEWRFEFPEVLDNDGNYIGFDVIIGNPPYIQLQKMGKDADALQSIGYTTYARTGDIYSLFYEKGQNLLRKHGHLIFITSNKWMRAGYGESTRKFLAEKTNPILLIDFAGQKLFDTATVDTNILLFSKGENEQKTQACTIKEEALNNLSDFVRQQSNISGFTYSDSWVILSEIEMRIKEKIEQIGTPLKDWDIQINYGIKTGFNDAFIITGEKREELIQQDPKSEEIIRPLLRGRDIKRYSYEFADLYIITTFPSLKIDIEQYPAVKQHLIGFGYDRLKQTGDKGARKKTNNQWFETQDSISYWEDFSKQKIIYPEITKFLNFYLDEQGFFVNNKCFILSGKYIYFLAAFLNSSLFKFCFRDNFPELLGGTRELRKIFVEQIPIIEINEVTESEFQALVTELVESRTSIERVNQIEREIDYAIFKLYNLSPAECESIGFIEIL